MKVKINEDLKVFKPITLTIQIESLAELINLERRLNVSVFVIRNSDILGSRTQYFKNHSCNTANQELWQELDKLLVHLGI